MKSIALSLLVAASVSLGALPAFADAARTNGPAAAAPATYLSSAQSALQRAEEHSRRAVEYRTAARIATEKAGHALRIAEDNAKQGFMWHAAQMRAKAAEYQKEAQANTNAAQREEAAAAYWRAQAKQSMAQYQPAGPAPHKPAGR